MSLQSMPATSSRSRMASQVECRGESLYRWHHRQGVCSAALRNPHGRRSVSHMMPSHDDVHLNTDRRSPFFYPFMLLLLMLSLCAYEDDRETICAGCFAFHEPAFVIIAGIIEGMVSYGSGGRVMRFKPIMWMIGCPLSKEDRINTDSRSP